MTGELKWQKSASNTEYRLCKTTLLFPNKTIEMLSYIKYYV